MCETLNISRKDAKDFLKKANISINGEVCKDSGKIIDESKDEIVVNGKKVSYEKFLYFMLNKPSDYITATKDDKQKTVLDLFKNEKRDDLFAVGRLDKDTVGLLIITNDGELSHHLTSPKHHVPKTYYLKTSKPVTSEAADKLREGVELVGDGMTKPAIVEILSDNEMKLTITEGMFHQVKRMLLAVDNEVTYLKRVSMGEVLLDDKLKEGEYRRLTEEEIILLKK